MRGSLFLLLGCTANGGGGDSGPGDDAVDTGEPTPPSVLPPSTDAEVTITEVLPSNATGIQDEGGAFPDWIELHNAADAEVWLTGFTLSEEDGWVDQWTFTEVSIPAGGYLVVFADGDEEEGPLHTNFKLSSTGEVVSLYGRAGDDHPRLDEVEFPTLPPDVSYALTGGTWAPDPTPTPGDANE
jgi:hypothetical protein